MLFAKLLNSVALTVIFTAGALADANTINTQLQQLQEQISGYKDSVNNYDGGYRTMVPLAAHTVRLNGRTTKARKTINESEPVPSEEAESVMDQHQKTVDSIKHTLNAALSKEAVEDPNGFRRLLALGVGYWGNEYDQLWNTLKTKIPEDMHARVASPSAELSDHFRTVQQRLS